MPSKPLLQRLSILFAVLTLPLLTLAASRGILLRHGSGSQPATPQTAFVSMVDFAFVPKTITITMGTQVRWTNNGTFPHTSTSDTNLWNSGDIAPGGMYTVTFNTPGVFPYHCIHHAPLMVGTVVVVGEDTYLPFITH